MIAAAAYLIAVGLIVCAFGDDTMSLVVVLSFLGLVAAGQAFGVWLGRRS